MANTQQQKITREQNFSFWCFLFIGSQLSRKKGEKHRKKCKAHVTLSDHGCIKFEYWLTPSSAI